MLKPGSLVLIKEELTMESVTPARVARVVQDLEDTLLVQPLNTLDFLLLDERNDDGEEIEVECEVARPIKED